MKPLMIAGSSALFVVVMAEPAGGVVVAGFHGDYRLN